MRILLAEDTLANVQLFRVILEGAGYDLDVAEDGKAAAEMGAQGAYDVILMDLGLPYIDGFEATKRIIAAGVSAPIVALTADDDSQTDRKCREAGMVDVLTKPVSPANLLKFIQENA